MRRLLAFAIVALTCIQSWATVDITVDALDLRDENGVLMPTSGLVILVASTENPNFAGPRADYFVTGDDVVLFVGSPLLGGWYQGSSGIELTGNLSSGDALQLFWFPTLTVADYNNGLGVPGEGVIPFGFYRHESGLDGSEAWTVPADGLDRTLRFYTINNIFDLDGNNNDSLGWASSTVAPVPEASNIIFGGLALGLVAFRLVPQIRRKLVNS